MRDIPAGLKTHLDETSTTLCHAWRLTRSDGLVMGFTEHDRALSFDGTVFSAATGFRGSEVETGLGLEADAAEIEGAFSDAAISPDDLALGRYDGARVETFLVNWQSPKTMCCCPPGNWARCSACRARVPRRTAQPGRKARPAQRPALRQALRCRSR
jgi:hypothetical protein